jgi:VanZ family protein
MDKISRFILWVLVVVWLLVIFYFSSQTGLESAALSDDVAKKISVGAVKVKRVVAVRPVVEKEVSERSEKAVQREQAVAKRRFYRGTRDFAHCVLYFVLGVLFFIALKNHGICSWKVFLWTIVFCVVISIGDELHQNFVPGRGAELNDLLRDLVGSICGGLFVCGMTKVKRVKGRKEERGI